MTDGSRRSDLVVAAGCAIFLLVGCGGSLGAAQNATPLDKAFARFWDAADPDAAAKVTKDIVGAGASFDDAWKRLRRGREYSKSVPHGVNRLTRRGTEGYEFNYAVVVPENYDPSRAYQVRVQLHGGVGRETGDPGREGLERIQGSPDQIYVHPVAWAQAKWWTRSQSENIPAILDHLKRIYNVDENHVYLTGISDGGTGTYYMSFRDTTPWASFMPLIGDMGVLADASVTTDGDMHPVNATNKPFFIVNCGRDRLYPTSIVEADINYFRRIGVPLVYHPQAEFGHDTNWWPMEKDNYEAFLHDHPRAPLPDHLTWETERTDRYNRAHWLVIDKLGSVGGESLESDSAYLFPQREPSGLVEVTRHGNTVEATTRAVKQFTLLISPDQFDFTAPIKVVTNGKVAFEGMVEKSVATLLKWASRDNDRTMLFGAELTVQVGK